MNNSITQEVFLNVAVSFCQIGVDCNAFYGRNLIDRMNVNLQDLLTHDLHIHSLHVLDIHSHRRLTFIASMPEKNSNSGRPRGKVFRQEVKVGVNDLCSGRFLLYETLIRDPSGEYPFPLRADPHCRKMGRKRYLEESETTKKLGNVTEIRQPVDTSEGLMALRHLRTS